jgi:outer membrane receptor protein involved in Fe transport
MEKAEVKRQKLGVRSQKSEDKRRTWQTGRRPPFDFRSRLGSALVSLLCTIVFACGARAATLKGTVFDPGGSAVAGARVTLLRSSAPLAESETDAQGRFEFRNLAAGAYSIVANAPGFSASETQVELRAAASERVDLHLALSAVEERVVVSASLGGALAPQVGSSVSVVDRRDIENRDAQNLYEALRGVPGVEVNQTGRRGGVTGVFIRGGNSNYNLVLLDGIPLNEFGGDFDFASLPADGVDEVEVARGPLSALYGSNAVAGVVNILSRPAEGSPRFSALGEGGSFTTWRAATGGSGLTHGLGWSYNLSRLDSDGVIQNDNYRDQSAFLTLSLAPNPRREFFFHFFGNANDAGAPGPNGSDPDHLYNAPIYPGGPTPYQVGLTSRDKQNLFGYGWNYSQEFSPRFREVVTGTLATNDFYFSSPLGDSYSNNKRATVNEQSQVTISPTDFFVAGLEWNREQVRNTFIADSTGTPFLLPRTTWAYFAENRWNPAARLFVIAGVRADSIRTHALPPGEFGVRPLLPASSITQVDPRISVAYMLRESEGAGWGATRLHSSFGTGIRPPDGFELAFTNNPQLKPERSLSFDAGAEQRLFRSRAVLDATYFYNRFEDQIVVLGGSLTNLSTFTSANLGNSRAEGLEISVRAQPTRSLQFLGEYTLLRTRLLAVNGSSLAVSPFQVGQPLIRRPKNSGFVGITYARGRLSLNSTASFRGQTLDIEPNDGTFACVPPPNGPGLPCFFNDHGYQFVGAGFSYRLVRGLEMYGRLNNLLNEKYEESFGFPALHLNFLSGVRFSFPVE